MGAPTTVATLPLPAKTLTVLGAISPEKVVSMEMKLPINHGDLDSLIEESEKLAYETRIDPEASTLTNATGRLQVEGRLFNQSGTMKNHFNLFLWSVMFKLKEIGPYNHGHLIMVEVALLKDVEKLRLVNAFNQLYEFNFKVCFLPAYSRQLNSIVNVWSAMRLSFQERQETPETPGRYRRELLRPVPT